ncbi:conserved hypothetical protein [Candidatus Desulfosporosinus infrequens]|uniref:Uncharacterized protein n=1 Tax=Candidatus Desulfosporosinus infrequens TaxID=2043169 RepID=A0A2U3LUC1_9FIRM|nr:conserved hypothetical protein [Candidatus Desulfosporosinus infrequens]
MAAKLKTELVQLRLTPLEKEKLKTLADQNQKSLSDYIRWLIDRESLKSN